MKSTRVSPRGDTCYFSVDGQPIYIYKYQTSERHEAKSENDKTIGLVMSCLECFTDGEPVHRVGR